MAVSTSIDRGTPSDKMAAGPVRPTRYNRFLALRRKGPRNGGVRVLADTNILIPLEDPSPLFNKAMADFARLTATYGWKVLVHPASFEDIQRDRNTGRREIVLSKLAKYPRLEKPAAPTPAFLNALDANPSEQDACDNRLLYAVAANAVDLLVTEDRGIHAKAKRLELNERIYYVTQCLTLIEHLHGERKRTPPAVHRESMHALSLSDPFFSTLRADYRGFDEWFATKARKGRECWLVSKPEGGIAALCIFNRERDPKETPLKGDWLKLCTFKVAPEFSGNKLGELLLKTAFGHCAQNKIVGTFVTAYPKHKALIGLFSEFGFQNVARLSDGELVLAKDFDAPPMENMLAADPVAFNTLFYPHYLRGERIQKFIVPVIPAYHSMLFPEWTMQQALFPSIAPVSNAIRKAYLCHASTNQVKEGDLVFFYRSQDAKAVTTVAVVEKTLRSSDPLQLAAFVGKRTVYALTEIEAMCARRSVLAIMFRQCQHATRAVAFKKLRTEKIINNHVETITAISQESAAKLLKEADL
jgi:GNAT superfamily N-acetyltransferase